MTPENKREVSSAPSQSGLILGALLGGLAVLFAVLNLDEVPVNWIVGTRSTPLIVVILTSLAIGCALGWLIARRHARG
jgi:lipopolysaccharide assembly protein A